MVGRILTENFENEEFLKICVCEDYPNLRSLKDSYNNNNICIYIYILGWLPQYYCNSVDNYFVHYIILY